MVESFMNKLISSVIIQGTENPVFGTFALPANISSYDLAAYYGEVSDLMFPTANPVNSVKKLINILKLKINFVQSFKISL